MTIKELDRIITVAVVIGEGAKREYEKSGVRGLYEGSVVAPSRWRIKVMDFLREEILVDYIEKLRTRLKVTAPDSDVIILRGDDVLLYEGLVTKTRRASERFEFGRNGLVRVKREGTCIRNAEAAFAVNAEDDVPVLQQSAVKVVYHDVTDILYEMNCKKGLYVHEIKGELDRYILDFNLMRYWKWGGVEPDPEQRIPGYSAVRDISFGARSFLKVAQETRAEILLDCTIRWTDYRLVYEVGRRFVTGAGKVTMMYNFYAVPARLISPFWFSGVDTSGKSKTLDNRAYVQTLRGRQWYHIKYSGTIQKEKFEEG